MTKKTMAEIYDEALKDGKVGRSHLVNDGTGQFKSAFFTVRKEAHKPEPQAAPGKSGYRPGRKHS